MFDGEWLIAKNKMIEDAKPITKNTFIKNCNFANEFIEDSNYFLDDPTHGYYKSKLRDDDCIYVQYCGFEFIFVKDYPIGKEYWIE